MANVDNHLALEIVSFEKSLTDRSHDEDEFVEAPSIEATVELAERIRSYGGDPGSDSYHGPLSTDYMYRESTVLPRIPWNQVVLRQVRLEQLSYSPIAGIIGTDWQMSALQLLKYSDRGDRAYLDNRRYVLGPYCAPDGRLLPGVRVYKNTVLE